MSARTGSRPPTSRTSHSSSWLPMCARSHTSVLISGECWATRSASSTASVSRAVRARAAVRTSAMWARRRSASARPVAGWTAVAATVTAEPGGVAPAGTRWAVLVAGSVTVTLSRGAGRRAPGWCSRGTGRRNAGVRGSRQRPDGRVGGRAPGAGAARGGGEVGGRGGGAGVAGGQLEQVGGDGADLRIRQAVAGGPRPLPLDRPGQAGGLGDDPRSRQQRVEQMDRDGPVLAGLGVEVADLEMAAGADGREEGGQVVAQVVEIGAAADLVVQDPGEPVGEGRPRRG